MKKRTTFSLFFWTILFLLYSCQEECPAPIIDKMVLIKADVKIEIGGILYENVDAHIKVNGYGADNKMQWSKDFNFVGPIDTLEVHYGYHHYSIELVNKWGIDDVQSEISAEQMWDGRVDGPLPVTYVLAGSKKAKKLSKYISYREIEVKGTGIVKLLESTTFYTYDNHGRVQAIKYEGYDSKTSQIIETTMQSFTYEGAAVSKIEVTVNGKPARVYQYGYGIENTIRETSIFNAGTWTQTNTRLYNHDNIFRVAYSFSNGSSLLWEFETLHRNIIADKTTKALELCYHGNYAFDKNINPFRHLGYMDFNFQNWDLNNALTEHVDYKACSFPVLTPVQHQYTYDQDGYPVTKITTYKRGSFENVDEPNYPYHTELNFYYE